MEELFSSPDLSDFPLSLHLDMLSDETRMQTYIEAIKSTVKPTDTVVDIGTGSGVLAMIAAKSGAKKVVGIDYSDIIDYAQKIKDLNCPDLDIQFIKRNILNQRLPEISADLIICELFGNFAIDESIVEILTTVKRHFLKPDGRIIPESFELMVAPVQCTKAYRDIANWRRIIHGLNFTPLQERAYNCVYHINNEPVRLLAEPCSLTQIELLTVETLPMNLQAEFSFNKNGTIHGIAGWFRSQLTIDHLIDSGPEAAHTHWGQVMFPIGDPVKIEENGTLNMTFEETLIDNESTWQWYGDIHPESDSDTKRAFSYQASRRFYD